MDGPNNIGIQAHRRHKKKSKGRKSEKNEGAKWLEKAELLSRNASGDKNEGQMDQSEEEAIAAKRQRNPRAFSVNSANAAQSILKRNLDREHKKLHLPVLSRGMYNSPESSIKNEAEIPLAHTTAPPIVVVVAGPPQVGKSTLIRSLVKRYTRQNISVDNIKGPITVVSGKNQRLTFIECGNDLNSMIDIAKVADLVLLLVDASFGFEMETFELLNILQVHGFPKIMGVLTHLDKFKDQKGLRKIKKKLKQRFWTEVYQGAKLFYLSGIIHNHYPKMEVHNLSRFIAVMKFRPLSSRNSHPYVLVDRMEDVTAPAEIGNNPKSDRIISLYGYVRGTNFKKGTRVHIPGVGDFDVKEIDLLQDPCPPPEKAKKRSLNEKERLLYAPMADVGNIVYDKDAVYINIPRASAKSSEYDRENQKMDENEPGLKQDDETDEGIRMLSRLQNANRESLRRHMPNGFRFFSNSEPTDFIQIGRDPGEIQDDSDPEHKKMCDTLEIMDEHTYDPDLKPSNDHLGPFKLSSNSECSDSFSDRYSDLIDTDHSHDHLGRDIEHFDHEDDNQEYSEERDASKFQPTPMESKVDGFSEDQNVDYASRWEETITNGSASLVPDNPHRVDIMRLVYGNQDGFAPNDMRSELCHKENSDEFFMRKVTPLLENINQEDVSKFFMGEDDLDNWDNEDSLQAIRNKFVTGNWNSSGPTDNTHVGDSESDVDGDFEDLETGETYVAFKDKIDDEEPEAEQIESKKERLKAKFNAEYDAHGEKDSHAGTYFDNLKTSINKQYSLNVMEFANEDPEIRAQYEGYRPGAYVRMVIERIPCEFVVHFDPLYPCLVGGLLQNEGNYGFIQARLKKHRWYKKILKNQDPLIFSMGWRRFQSIPIYSINDGVRNRMLKYTPEHMHCLATFYGPYASPNTSFCAFQTVSNQNLPFRMSATGTVTEIDQSFHIVKKLKLVGVPFKIFKNTAFIKGMFTSALEVAKFESATIQTVSGIRGQIKRALSKPPGCYRATFEDKILMSDIVFLRAWYPVKMRKYCNVVTNLLLPGKREWKGMHLVSEIRTERHMPIRTRANSVYQLVDRPERKFNPFKIPASLAAELPFSSKPKLKPHRKHKQPTIQQRRALIMEPEEKRIKTLLQQIHTVKNEKLKKRKHNQEERKIKYIRRKELDEDARKKGKRLQSQIYHRRAAKLEKQSRNKA